LHVLSLPPAFVLSQDQTLKLKNLISTVVTTQIDRVHLTPTDVEAVYSPKHRTGRCLFMIVKNDPQGHRRLRFSFFLHLSKSKSRPHRTEKRNPTTPPASQRQSPEASSPAPHAVAAVDEAISNRTRRSGQHSFRRFSEFFECSSAPRATGTENPFSEEEFLLSYTDRTSLSSSMNSRMLRQRSPQNPRMTS
jgi:hypothetical protein